MMRRLLVVFLVLWGAGLLGLFSLPIAPARSAGQAMDAAEAGFDRARLEAIRAELEKRGTRALLVMRRGRVAYEWYAAGVSAQQRHGTASLAKSLVGGMSLLFAMNDGRLRPDDRAASFLPAWRDDPRKSRVLIRHLATHTSGIEDAEENHKPHEALTGWKGAFWRRDPDPFSIAVHQAPVLFAPGSRFHYSNPGMAALAYAVTKSLEGTLQPEIRSQLLERLMKPLGIPEEEWSIGYGRAYELDGLKLYANWGGGAFSARATAAIGRLMMQGGRWNGKQLADPAWVSLMTASAATARPPVTPENPAPAAGLCWWNNTDGQWAGVPRDAFAGAGAGHQLLLVVPSLDLIAVRYGQALVPRTSRDDFWGPAVTYVFQPIVGALRAEEDRSVASRNWPYPPSRVIRAVKFAPVDSIRRAAKDSDNWPMTWGDDDTIYTSYGDGRGFEPYMDRKVSMGFARISGPPEGFGGENIRSETGERPGDGPAGPKASGMLMVDGVLYLWARNTGNAQLLWSEDRGKTWQWGFRFEKSFGSPAFLNFGRNYAGARDGFVYVYSQDGPSAYESDDQVVLARVHRKRIREKEAYEFFVKRDGSGRPVWTRDMDRRGSVFRYPGHCHRLDAVYNPGIKRYLLVLAFNHQSGWGMFDAPEPWGPWSTAFLTEAWDLAGTHGYRLPVKWISRDGARMHLVFSGVSRADDAFCVRALDLQVTR